MILFFDVQSYLFSICFQIGSYILFFHIPKMLTGRVRMLLHFGHFCGVDKTVQ